MKAHNKVIPINRDNSPMTTNLPEPLTTGQAEILELANQGLDIYSIAIKSQLTAAAARRVLVCCSNKGHAVDRALIEGRV